MRALVALVLLCLAVVAGCGSERESEAPITTETSASAPGQSSGPPAPVIEGETFDGERLSLADLRGKPVLVNVWSSW